MFLQLFILFLFTYYVLLRWKARHRIKFAKNFKNGLKSYPIIGHANLFVNCRNDKDRWRIMKTFGGEALTQGGATCSWILHRLYFLVADPVIAETVMKHCLEKDDAMKLTFSYVSNCSAVAEVPIWRPRRKTLLPSFSQKYLMQFVKIFSKQSMVLIQQLQKAGEGTLSMSKYVSGYTMDSVSETTLGIEAHSQEIPNQKLLAAIFHCCRLVSNRLMKPWLHLDPIYKLTSEHSELMIHKDTIFSMIQDVITEKRRKLAISKANNNKIDDDEDDKTLKPILELMIESTDLSDTTLIEEGIVLFTAGTDTTALATSFTTVLLARHPDVQDKVYKELVEVYGDSKRPVLFEDLPHLKYLEVVIKESMRLYPPGPFLLRKVEKDVVLPSGLTLPKDTGIYMNVYATHRNPKYWGDDAEQFRPERFFDSPPKHPAAFMAFSNGPRNCIGYRYAMMSMKTVLATILRHYRVLPESEQDLGQPIDLKFDIMLRAADDFQVVLEPRS